jgi:hypothetical protein
VVAATAAIPLPQHGVSVVAASSGGQQHANQQQHPGVLSVPQMNLAPAPTPTTIAQPTNVIAPAMFHPNNQTMSTHHHNQQQQQQLQLQHHHHPTSLTPAPTLSYMNQAQNQQVHPQYHQQQMMHHPPSYMGGVQQQQQQHQQHQNFVSQHQQVVPVSVMSSNPGVVGVGMNHHHQQQQHPSHHSAPSVISDMSSAVNNR